MGWLAMNAWTLMVLAWHIHIHPIKVEYTEGVEIHEFQNRNNANDGNVSIANGIVKNQHWHYLNITEITWIWNAWSKCEFEPDLFQIKNVGIAPNAKIGNCINFMVFWLSCIVLLNFRHDQS
eukprot:276438_1